MTSLRMVVKVVAKSEARALSTSGGDLSALKWVRVSERRMVTCDCGGCGGHVAVVVVNVAIVVVNVAIVVVVWRLWWK